MGVKKMTKKEFSKALELAKSNKFEIANLSLFDGFGLKEFKPVACTLNDVAGLISWQAICFNASIDNEALNEVYKAKAKFIVV